MVEQEIRMRERQRIQVRRKGGTCREKGGTEGEQREQGRGRGGGTQLEEETARRGEMVEQEIRMRERQRIQVRRRSGWEGRIQR